MDVLVLCPGLCSCCGRFVLDLCSMAEAPVADTSQSPNSTILGKTLGEVHVVSEASAMLSASSQALSGDRLPESHISPMHHLHRQVVTSQRQRLETEFVLNHLHRMTLVRADHKDASDLRKSEALFVALFDDPLYLLNGALRIRQQRAREHLGEGDVAVWPDVQP